MWWYLRGHTIDGTVVITILDGFHAHVSVVKRFVLFAGIGRRHRLVAMPATDNVLQWRFGKGVFGTFTGIVGEDGMHFVPVK